MAVLLAFVRGFEIKACFDLFTNLLIAHDHCVSNCCILTGLMLSLDMVCLSGILFANEKVMTIDNFWFSYPKIA